MKKFLITLFKLIGITIGYILLITIPFTFISNLVQPETFYGFSKEFHVIYNMARKAECWFINLDKDGETYPHLKQFDW